MIRICTLIFKWVWPSVEKKLSEGGVAFVYVSAVTHCPVHIIVDGLF